MGNGLTGKVPVSLYSVSKTLQIPSTSEEKSLSDDTEARTGGESNQEQMIKQFCSLEKCTAFEAKTYLQENQYNLEAAQKARAEWLHNQRRQAPPEVNPFALSHAGERLSKSTKA